MIPFQKMIDGVRKSGLGIADNMAYVRATHELNLSGTQRMTISAGTGQSINPSNPKAMQETSIRLLTSPSQPSDILALERLEEEDQDGGEPTRRWPEISRVIDQVWKSRKLSARRNRLTLITPIGKDSDGKVKGDVQRKELPILFGSSDRYGGECRLPSQPIPAFGGSQKEKGMWEPPSFCRTPPQ